MGNAKREFIRELEGKKPSDIVCWMFIRDYDAEDGFCWKFILEKWYTNEDYKMLLEFLDFEHEGSYMVGEQIFWSWLYKDWSWVERDGCEEWDTVFWTHYKLPEELEQLSIN